jgi:hypothetical protein
MSVLLMLLTSSVGAKVGYWCFFSLWSVLHLSWTLKCKPQFFSVILLVVLPLSADNFIPFLCSCRSNSKSSSEGYEGRRINYIPCKKPSAGINAWFAPKFSVPFLYHASLFIDIHVLFFYRSTAQFNIVLNHWVVRPSLFVVIPV